MKKVHYYSGLVLTLFISAHLFNHLIGVFGESCHIEVMDQLRVVYRNRIIESLLLLVVGIQVITGIKLYVAKRKVASSFFEKIHIWSGLYLAFFLLFHVSAVLIGRKVFGLDTNIYFSGAGLNIFPYFFFFIPYYTLAILSFFGHIAAIHSLKMKYPLLGWSPNQQSKLILLLGFVTVVFIFYSQTNGFSGLEIPAPYLPENYQIRDF